MMRHRLLVSLVCVTFISACVTNPARHLSPNDEEVQVREELDGAQETAMVDKDGDGKPDQELSPYVRGTEALDEQEFYDVIGDTESAEKIRSSRSAGAALEGLGFGTMIVGILAAVVGAGLFFLSNDELMPPPFVIEDKNRQYLLYGTLGSVGVAALGGLLYGGMKPQARGDKKIFDLVHARRRLEISIYGENGATPDDIKSFTFGKGNESSRVCAGQTLTLAPVVALDARGRAMRVSGRADWFQWRTTPKDGLVTHVPDAPVLSSSLISDFATVNEQITLALEIPETHLSYSMTFPHDFGCPSELAHGGVDGRSGGTGRSGGSGHSGSSNRSPTDGLDGVDGADGAPANPGTSVEAEVAWVRTEKQGRLALLVVGTEAQLFDPSKTKVSVLAQGGRGGSGGDGGDGGTGGSAWMQTCSPGGDGGRGGRGGRGASGGPGGKVRVRAADQDLLDAVSASAPGGGAGRGGSAGGAGGKGSSGSCKKGFPKEGRSGTRGAPGKGGTEGAEGSVETSVVGVSDLRRVAAVVAQNPTLTLEGATKKRR